MEQARRCYIIGIGTNEDFDTGHAAVYVEDRRGERVLPVFFAPEPLERYVEALIADSASGPETVAQLRAGHYRVLELEGSPELADIAMWIGADCIAWSPATSGGGQIYRIPDSPEQATRRAARPN